MNSKPKATFMEKIKNVIHATLAENDAHEETTQAKETKKTQEAKKTKKTQDSGEAKYNKSVTGFDFNSTTWSSITTETYKSSDAKAPKGSPVTKDFKFDNIHAVDSNTSFDIILNNNPENKEDSATVEAYEKQMDKIHLTEQNGILFIRADNGTYNRVTISINSRHINDIKVTGTGDVDGNFEGKNLTIKNSGTGDFSLSGNVTNLDIKNTGTGDMNFDSLETEAVEFNNSGTGDLHFSSVKEISGKNSGTGDVSYFGVQSSSIKNSGVGDIKYRGEKNKSSKKNI